MSGRIMQEGDAIIVGNVAKVIGVLVVVALTLIVVSAYLG